MSTNAPPLKRIWVRQAPTRGSGSGDALDCGARGSPQAVVINTVESAINLHIEVILEPST
jgi:hypothetical protein